MMEKGLLFLSALVSITTFYFGWILNPQNQGASLQLRFRLRGEESGFCSELFETSPLERNRKNLVHATQHPTRRQFH
jgi:hypothetical protein